MQTLVLLLIKSAVGLACRPMAMLTLAITIVAAFAGSMCVPQSYRTQASEWRTVTLSDGTVATLGPRTDIVMRYDPGRRGVQQLTGEAMYEVAKDTERPFFVQCGVATVQAIGTKFSVNCDSPSSIVTVAEGAVTVARRSSGSGALASMDHVRAEAGQQVRLDEWVPLIPTPIDVDRALAWERGRMIFSGASLEQAIGEFNRRHTQQIPIPSGAGKHYRVFGEFNLEDPEAFVRFVQMTSAHQPAAKHR